MPFVQTILLAVVDCVSSCVGQRKAK